MPKGVSMGWKVLLNLLLSASAFVGFLASILLGSVDHPLVWGHGVIFIALLVMRVKVGCGLSFARPLGPNRSIYWSRVFTIVLLLSCVVVINFLVYRADKRWDLTAEQVYSLTPETLALVADLSEPVELVALERSKVIDLRVVTLLFERYVRSKPNLISARVFHPARDPYAIDRYGFQGDEVLAIRYGQGESSRTLRFESISEEIITSTITRLQQGATRRLYYIVGHGEPELASSAPEGFSKLKEAVGDQGLELALLMLGEVRSVPDDAAAVLLASPTRALTAVEVETLESYVQDGGRLLALHDPQSDWSTVPALASKFGITVGKNVIIDPDQRFHGADLWQVTANHYEPHAITKLLKTNELTIFVMATTVSAERKGFGGRAKEFVFTGSNTWAETNFDLLFGNPPQAVRELSEPAGKLPLAVAWEQENTPKGSEHLPGRLVVIGDSEWAKNLALDVYANRQLLLGVLGWLTDSGIKGATRQRSLRQSVTPLPAKTVTSLQVLLILSIEMFMIVGLLVYWRRVRRGSKSD